MILDWYFNQTAQSVWLSTSLDTRASDFYRKAGWSDIGKHDNGEVKFEMTSIVKQDVF